MRRERPEGNSQISRLLILPTSTLLSERPPLKPRVGHSMHLLSVFPCPLHHQDQRHIWQSAHAQGESFFSLSLRSASHNCSSPGSSHVGDASRLQSSAHDASELCTPSGPGCASALPADPAITCPGCPWPSWLVSALRAVLCPCA